MTSPDILRRHLQLCDELHQLTLEENRFLKEQQRAPDTGLLERRRQALARLEESIASLKTADAATPPLHPDQRHQRRDTIEQAKARILQILHLQRENEQLVLRFSLGPKKAVALAPAPPPPSKLQKIYEQHR